MTNVLPHLQFDLAFAYTAGTPVTKMSTPHTADLRNYAIKSTIARVRTWLQITGKRDAQRQTADPHDAGTSSQSAQQRALDSR